ncbi:MAG: transcriptional regulator, MarR family [Herbinix sp.]|jgi:predicted GNAT family N-acyltransferase|nr:transcriptional regulator, MarR family [Herbinix sp.]
MNDLILRKATSLDMDDIIKLQLDVFKGEQKIPAVMIPLAEESSPQWWCALLDTSIVGAVAAWMDNNQVHWGRFATNQSYRGLRIGTKLAQFSLEDLFSQGIEEIYMDARDATVKIICDMGGKIIGEPADFYDGKVTPVILYKKDYGRKGSQ